MKKLIIAVLMTAAINTALIQAGGEKDTPKRVPVTQKVQPQAKSNLKKDLAKGLAALAGTGLFSYLSYVCHAKRKSTPAKFVESLTEIFNDNISSKFINLIPESTLKNYVEEYFGIIGNAAIATSLGAYAASKLYPIVKSKLTKNNGQSNARALKISDQVKIQNKA